MKVVVLGDGLLGSEIVEQTGWDYISRKKDGFDITKSSFHTYFVEAFEGVAFAKKYDVIVNCIAYTNTYYSKKDPHWEVNYKAVANLVDFCNQWKIKLVHISTDYVYTNSVSHANENDIPIHGSNWYSYTKLLADAYIELKSEDYLICRGTHKPYPFKYEGAWVDQVGNFDYDIIIANMIVSLVKTNASGLYNVGTELKSMYDLAKVSKNEVTPLLKPDVTPSNTSMSTLKLKEWFSKNS